MTELVNKREQLQNTFFPEKIPTLWCPLLTHYTDSGEIDKQRMRQHIKYLRPYVSTFLAPGSTGDGWEMEESEIQTLLDFLLDEADEQKFWLMIGVLKTGKGEALQSIKETVKRLFNNENAPTNDFVQKRICGFTVTPPKGKDLKQEEIYSELEAILESGYPTALYQLPQITENEMSPLTIQNLAEQYPNFYLMKDTSGEDKVVLSEVDTFGVFMVRGAEGNYFDWMKTDGGHYDGLLLSTANCFAAQLSDIIKYSKNGQNDLANKVSKKISNVAEEVFSLAADLSFGNQFTNANKLIDHHLAHGKNALKADLPMTHSGNRLPEELIKKTGVILEKYSLLPEKGYLD
ncbi:MAG: dihydrodipicolinate synthase family protein [Halothermotrichaceae bacterium]